YYALASNIRWFSRLHWVMRGSLLKTLASKHRSTVCKMARKYAGTTISADWKMLKCMQVVIERPGKMPLVARFGGISLTRKKDVSIRDELTNPVILRRTELE